MPFFLELILTLSKSSSLPGTVPVCTSPWEGWWIRRSSYLGCRACRCALEPLGQCTVSVKRRSRVWVCPRRRDADCRHDVSCLSNSRCRQWYRSWTCFTTEVFINAQRLVPCLEPAVVVAEDLLLLGQIVMERALAQEARDFVEAHHTQVQLVASIIEWPVTQAALVVCPHCQLVGGKVFHHCLPQFEAAFNDGFAVPSSIKSTFFKFKI